ncbi:MAG: hypothetical protein ABI471_12205 [Sphingomonas bacterium]
MKLGVASSILLLGTGLAVSVATMAQDSAIQIDGWNLADVGHKPGDDSNRLVSIEKVTPQVDMIYRPGERNVSGSIQAEISVKGCSRMSVNAGFDLPDPPGDRAAVVRKEMHTAFTDFAKSCKIKVELETEVMTGFAEAFAAVDRLMTDKPSVYLPAPPENGNSQ